MKIKASTLLRLANIITVDQPDELKVIMLQGKELVVTNKRIAVVEHLPDIEPIDSTVFITVNEELINNLQAVFLTDGYVDLTITPELCYGVLTTDTGYKSDTCFKWLSDSPLLNWRDWIELADSNNGFMYWDLFQMQLMFKASVSGCIVFPEFIDSNKPVVVADVENENWLGVFIPSLDSKKKLKPVELKEWIA